MSRLAPCLATLAPLLLSVGCAPEDFLPVVDVQIDTEVPSDVADGDDASPDTGGTDEPTLEELALLKVTPSTGPSAGGNEVLLEGSGFIPGLEVRFGETAATRVYVLSDSRAVARPAPSAEPVVTVSLRRPGSDWVVWDGGRYTFVSGAELHAVEPNEGSLAGGEWVRLKGSQLERVEHVYFGATPASQVNVLSPEELEVLTPPGEFGLVDVSANGPLGHLSVAQAFHYIAPPRLTHLSPLAGYVGDELRLYGTSLSAKAHIHIGAREAQVIRADIGGAWLDVEVPQPAPFAQPQLQGIHVETDFGSATLENAFAYLPLAGDPYALQCSHFAPKSMPQTGGTLDVACNGLQYSPIRVFVGDSELSPQHLDLERGILSVLVPPGSGEALIRVSNAVAGPVEVGSLHYESAPFDLAAVSPSRIPAAEESSVLLNGQGFQMPLSIRIGGAMSPGVEWISETQLRVQVPALPPQQALIDIEQAGQHRTFSGLLEVYSNTLGLSLVSPTYVARSGGTRLLLLGSGFDDTVSVWLEGHELPIVERLGSTGLAVLSPDAPEGSYTLEVRQGSERVRYPGIVTLYDPRGGSLGAWGGPIQGELNVSVWATGGYGPVGGALVYVKTAAGEQHEALTNAQGQVTISAPSLRGPIEVWASRDGFSAYSIHDVNARNVTLQLQQNPLPPIISDGNSGGGGGTIVFPPNATISGRVTGFDKYIVAPPGTCAALVDSDTGLCTPCQRGQATACGNSEAPELSSTLSCEVLPSADGLSTEERCLTACDAAGACPSGFACAGAKCYPTPAQKAAYCNISSTSIFGYENAIQATGWVDAERRYTLDSLRLGEIAVYCVGGYRDHLNTFTPSVLGVKRNLVVASGEAISLDIELEYPLDRTFKLRLQEPPLWPTGLTMPSVGIAINLGPDGALPFSRALIRATEHPSGEGDVYWAPRQLESLTGALADASYVFYTQLAPANATSYQPRSFHLRQHVGNVSEDRLPILEATQDWDLSQQALELDIYDALSFPDADSIQGFAVGHAGALYHLVGSAWHKQPALSTKTLLSLDGLAPTDIWAAGEQGTLLHWNGVQWASVEAPLDRYSAILVTDEAIYVAGDIRVRRYDRATQTWSLWGAPALQRVRAFVRDGAHYLAFGAGAKVARWQDGETSAEVLTLPFEAVVRDGLRSAHSHELTLVGDDGFFAHGPNLETLNVHQLSIHDLGTILEDANHGVVIAGDFGEVWLGASPSELQRYSPEGYQARFNGVVSTREGALHFLGSRAFALGPFMHFPLLTVPDPTRADDEELRLGWSVTGRRPAYVRLQMFSPSYVSEWTSLMSGYRSKAGLPLLYSERGIDILKARRFRLEALATLSEGFAIDDFTTQSFSTYLRDSWATNEAHLYIE